MKFIHNGEECINFLIDNYDSLEKIRDELSNWLHSFQKESMKRLIEIVEEKRGKEIANKLKISNGCYICSGYHFQVVEN